MTVRSTSGKKANPNKVRKLQSNVPCGALAEWTGIPCKFTAKPGFKYCGQHVKAIERFNKKILTEAIVSSSLCPDGLALLDGFAFSNCDDNPVPVVLYTLLENIGPIAKCTQPMSTPLAHIKVGDIHKATAEQCKPYLRETRLPHGVEESNGVRMQNPSG